jgi:antibiotic biosynthesis monooxygenase (ABM) superfamily enzyme
MGRQAANFDQSRKALEHLVEAAKQNQYDAVIQEGEAVRRMYPEYIGAANPYEFIAAADLAKGDKKAAESRAH